MTMIWNPCEMDMDKLWDTVYITMTFHGNENSRKTRKNGRNMGYSMIQSQFHGRIWAKNMEQGNIILGEMEEIWDIEPK